MAAGDVWEKVAGTWVKRTTLVAPAAATPPVRTVLALTNGWTNYSDITNFSVLSVAKDAAGTCTLHGLAQNTALTEANYYSALATLPAGMRPGWNMAFELLGIALDNTAVQSALRVNFGKDGTISLGEAYLPSTLVYFDGPSWVGV